MNFRRNLPVLFISGNWTKVRLSAGRHQRNETCCQSFFNCLKRESASFESCVISFFFRFLFWRYFEKIVTGKTTVVNPSVIEEHPEFSNFECGLQRVGFKSSESYSISLLAGTKGRVILAMRYSALQFL